VPKSHYCDGSVGVRGGQKPSNHEIVLGLRSGRSTQLIWTDLMILSRQQFLRLAACSAALTAASRLVMAHAYLGGQSEMLVPYWQVDLPIFSHGSFFQLM
jgi:hypothetical protein